MPDLPQGKPAYFEVNNRGKKGIVLDLVKEKGKEVIYRLAKDSDVFVHNFRQGVPERLKLNYETLRRYNPKIIYAAASGYGARGPDVAEPAFVQTKRKLLDELFSFEIYYHCTNIGMSVFLS